jgi:hypothetical protein
MLVLIASGPAHAITMDQIPVELKNRLPDFLWDNIQAIDPRALDFLTLADLCEYAEAYESGTLRFVDQVEICECGGPLTEELARLVLQIPTNAPFIEERFVRLAKEAYGLGVFSSLRWAVVQNEDESVNIKLWYKSNNPKSFLPDISYSGVGRLLFGLHYRDLFHGMENKQLEVALGSSGREPEEVTGLLSWTDNTLNGGTNAVSARLQVYNDWRVRLGGTTQETSFRDRITTADTSYAWTKQPAVRGNASSLTVGGGLYQQDRWAYRGNPNAPGIPRAHVREEGEAGYVSVGWSNIKRDSVLLPREGWYYHVLAEQHMGDWNFTRIKADLRHYYPVRNIFGVYVPCVEEGGCVNDVAQQFPPATIAVQAQIDLATGDVPYSQERRLGNMEAQRGYPYDKYPGIRVLGLRSEYRFALDQRRQYEMYVFNDNSFVGETFKGLENLSSVGAGAIMRLPFNEGMKVGAYYGKAISDPDDSWGVSLGYAF